MSLEALLLFLLLTNFFTQGVYSESVFTIVNDCPHLVWPVISGSDSFSGSGFDLPTGQSVVFNAPPSWRGRIWGRTNCSEGSAGNFTCATGGCDSRRRECGGGNATTSVTLIELELNASAGLDFYTVNLIDGYNLPVLVAPHGASVNSCKTTGCTADLSEFCPPELRLEGSGGAIVACQGPCRVFQTDYYCCPGNAPCKPNNYSQVFQNACPDAYSNLEDNLTSQFECPRGADYTIAFCPSPNRLLETPASQGNQPSPPSRQGTRGTKRRTLIIVVVVSATVLLVVGLALFIMWKIKQGEREKRLDELLMLDGYTETRGLKGREAKNHDLRLFTYESILSATNNFSKDCKLGEGGFGSVYKGSTPNGQDIAVKLLSRQSGQGLLEFKTELILISKLQHVNLVKLLGLCIHGEDKMIIYDYMPNKSLDFFLFSPSQREQLNWDRRLNIIEGIAQGLLYLHKYSRLKIIHRDLKPSNILLDANMNAKISDFGLARVFEQNVDEAKTNRRVGTYGYMAPEYAMQGIISVKSDVYSFGVLVLEIVSGRKNNCFNQIEGPLNLVEYAWELWRTESLLELMDPAWRGTCISDQLQRCVHIALLCVENRAVDRPSIEDVILMLKSETRSLPLPKNPSFIARNFVHSEVKRSVTNSTNEVTLSEVKGR